MTVEAERMERAEVGMHGAKGREDWGLLSQVLSQGHCAVGVVTVVTVPT